MKGASCQTEARKADGWVTVGSNRARAGLRGRRWTFLTRLPIGHGCSSCCRRDAKEPLALWSNQYRCVLRSESGILNRDFGESWEDRSFMRSSPMQNECQLTRKYGKSTTKRTNSQFILISEVSTNLRWVMGHMQFLQRKEGCKKSRNSEKLVSSKHPIGTKRVQRKAYSQRIVAQKMENEDLGDVEMNRLEKLFG